ncbi:MAG: shikimate kinase [Rubellimicrobium sp.]|nr:shikimate kinase [Rubellimicrobium sp.]
MGEAGRTVGTVAGAGAGADAGGRRRLLRPVVLVGMMGSGKTAVGRALAQKLGVPFLDSDAAIEEAAQASIAEIFARDGEAFFRTREAEVIARLLAGPPAILSTGGGAFMQERVRALIPAQGAVSVWLDAAVETLWNRVRHRDTRPLLRTADPRGTLARIHAERVPVYALADLAVRAEPHFSIDETAREVIAALAGRPGVLAAGE